GIARDTPGDRRVPQVGGVGPVAGVDRRHQRPAGPRAAVPVIEGARGQDEVPGAAVALQPLLLPAPPVVVVVAAAEQAQRLVDEVGLGLGGGGGQGGGVVVIAGIELGQQGAGGPAAGPVVEGARGQDEVPGAAVALQPLLLPAAPVVVVVAAGGQAQRLVEVVGHALDAGGVGQRVVVGVVARQGDRERALAGGR